MDGPSGSGKSSVAKGVARALALRYLDTGAMYRAITWWMLRNGVDVDDADAVAARAGEPVLVSGTVPYDSTITVDGEDVSGPIRSDEVTKAVSAVASVAVVRRHLVDQQRDIIGTGGIVVEGRDIGSVVAPNAEVKLYVTASAKVRARRRAGEIAGATIDATQADLARRDQIDSSRAVDPLMLAPGAIELDTTHLTLDEVIAEVLRIVKERNP